MRVIMTCIGYTQIINLRVNYFNMNVVDCQAAIREYPTNSLLSLNTMFPFMETSDTLECTRVLNTLPPIANTSEFVVAFYIKESVFMFLNSLLILFLTTMVRGLGEAVAPLYFYSVS